MPSIIVEFTRPEQEKICARAPLIFLFDKLADNPAGIESIAPTANPNEFIVNLGPVIKRPAWPTIENLHGRVLEKNRPPLTRWAHLSPVRLVGRWLKRAAQFLIIILSIWINFLILAALMLVFDTLFPGVLSMLLGN